VAKDFFVQVDTVRDATMVDGCIEMFVFIHQSIEKMPAKFLEETKRRNYVTRTSYLKLLNLFESVIKTESTKRFSQNINIKHRATQPGLEELRETERSPYRS
jgi:hypothetical protein